MKSYSLHQQPTYSPSGKELRINFNHQLVETSNEWEETSSMRVCDQILLSVTATREQIIDAINLIDPSQAETLADGWFRQEEKL
jgi:hypothetical protein